MKIDWARLPLLVAVVLLLLGGARQYLADDQDVPALALLAAGLVVLGAWTAIEVITAHHTMHRDDDGEDDAGH